ncbi:MAG: Prolipoprotein diacylglyceryl transferase [Candidatus Moranbacteria bacterium GW2011_GWE1_35_17]|nr:MAG: Prolipoprotein diacylglyceryl transferase [Candidatus Moranbacteria bacterium GW2011_GWE1_35_17]KKP81947.1 MAG: Prolipoprotein diacylglyceryl transferase [Candidatus Moranbacteria bacterium GW2011_GWF1_35_5]KKP83200.1 MAG: Prolipoprotein diacylglyceryl transferase [Candidatus Moranbacteria bacterium GW2011_GWF2_35_54]
MLDFYQNLPEKINPVIFSVDFFSVYWYSLMYLIGFITVAGLLYWRIYKKEANFSWDDIFEFLLNSFLAIVIGGRIGYVVFYNLNYFLVNPLEIIWPFNPSGEFTGIYGMSYHGAAVGFILATYFFCKKRKISFLKLTDFILPAIPAGYFFGRIGNFLNGELYGRITTSKWGMDFGDGLIRHPSQLYEAFLEGIFLFIILWLVRNKLSKHRGMISGLYLLGYGIFRSSIEFFREPDAQLGFIFNYLTMGQILSLIMISGGLYLINKNVKH